MICTHEKPGRATPDDPEYQKLARSVEVFGLVEPLVWNQRTGHLVGGHQRFKVLLEQGARHVEVSVVDLPPAKEKALNVALNKISGDWDERKLAELLDELMQTPDLDLELTGFEFDEAEDLIADLFEDSDEQGGDDGFDVDATLEAAGPVVTKPGDLNVLGRERQKLEAIIANLLDNLTADNRVFVDQRLKELRERRDALARRDEELESLELAEASIDATAEQAMAFLVRLASTLREGLPQEKLLVLRQCIERVWIDRPAGTAKLRLRVAPVGQVDATAERRVSLALLP